MEPMKHLHLHLLLIFLSVYGAVCASATQSPTTPTPKADAAPKILLSSLENPDGNHVAPSVELTKPGHLPFAADDNIRKICNKTDYPDLCLSGVAPYLDGKDDPSSVIQMLVKAAKMLALTTQAKVKKVSVDPATDSFTARIFDLCWGTYDDSISSLDSAMKSLKSHDIAAMDSYLSSALSTFGVCDDAFSEGGHGSPVEDMDKQLEDLVSNCLAISSQFIKK